MNTISLDEVRKHTTKEDVWIIFRGKVYDLSSYVDNHPGGLILLNHAGKDATAAILAQSAHQYVFNFILTTLEKHQVGVLATTASADSSRQ